MSNETDIQTTSYRVTPHVIANQLVIIRTTSTAYLIALDQYAYQIVEAMRQRGIETIALHNSHFDGRTKECRSDHFGREDIRKDTVWRLYTITQRIDGYDFSVAFTHSPDLFLACTWEAPYRAWVTILAQRDTQPDGGYRPSSVWQACIEDQECQDFHQDITDGCFEPLFSAAANEDLPYFIKKR